MAFKLKPDVESPWFRRSFQLCSFPRGQSLIDKTISSVAYDEIDYEDGKFPFFDGPRFDSLGYAWKLNSACEELDKSSSMAILKACLLGNFSKE